MIRVVLDTNIVVSALLQPLGPSARLFLLALGGAIQVCVSGAIYAEYEDVIRRPSLPPQRCHHSCRPRCHPRQVPLGATHRTGALCSDPDDDPFLECCQASSAAYLVTGNIKHFPSQWRETRIVTPRRFLYLFTSE